MNAGIHKEVIKKLRVLIPRKSDLSRELSDLLCLSKESIYRRLRGEVAFTFDEISRITRKFDISIDDILGNGKTSSVNFEISVKNPDDDEIEYIGIISRYADLFGKLSDDPSSEIYCAYNIIPALFFNEYKTLLKFSLLRYHIYDAKSKARCLDDMVIPLDVLKEFYRLSDNVRNIATGHMILDHTIISSLVKEIKYFRSINWLSDNDVANLHRELSILQEELEELALNGINEKGNPIHIYISELDIEASCLYICKKDFETAIFKVYSVSFIDTRDRTLCDFHKRWLMTLKRHSMLISQSGEAERNKFFMEQRDELEKLKT